MSEIRSRSSRVRRQKVQRELGFGIRDARRRQGWSREELAERLGVPLHNLAKWELGVHAPPLNELMGLLEVLEVTFEELVLRRRKPALALPAANRNELSMCMNRLARAVRPLLAAPNAKEPKEE